MKDLSPNSDHRETFPDRKIRPHVRAALAALGAGELPLHVTRLEWCSSLTSQCGQTWLLIAMAWYRAVDLARQGGLDRSHRIARLQ
jgi:hypothetical protein